MSERSEKLKKDLDSLMSEWMSGDEGRILIRPTAADRKKAFEVAKNVPDDYFARKIAVLVAGMVTDALVTQGKRPADYWQDKDIPAALATRLAKVLQTDVFVSTFQAILKGGG